MWLLRRCDRYICGSPTCRSCMCQSCKSSWWGKSYQNQRPVYQSVMTHDYDQSKNWKEGKGLIRSYFLLWNSQLLMHIYICHIVFGECVRWFLRFFDGLPRSCGSAKRWVIAAADGLKDLVLQVHGCPLTAETITHLEELYSADSRQRVVNWDMDWHWGHQSEKLDFAVLSVLSLLQIQHTPEIVGWIWTSVHWEPINWFPFFAAMGIRSFKCCDQWFLRHAISVQSQWLLPISLEWSWFLPRNIDGVVLPKKLCQVSRWVGVGCSCWCSCWRRLQWKSKIDGCWSRFWCPLLPTAMHCSCFCRKTWVGFLHVSTFRCLSSVVASWIQTGKRFDKMQRAMLELLLTTETKYLGNLHVTGEGSSRGFSLWWGRCREWSSAKCHGFVGKLWRGQALKTCLSECSLWSTESDCQ